MNRLLFIHRILQHNNYHNIRFGGFNDWSFIFLQKIIYSC